MKIMKVSENKLVILGAGGVGKTSLVSQFMDGNFSAHYKPTVEDCYRHTFRLPDGLFHTVEILDTAGSHHFPAMRDLSIRQGRGFILVFSLADLASFHETLALYGHITRIRGPCAPVVLVGNKCDLESERAVPEQTISEFTSCSVNQSRGHTIPYLETSAKYNTNVARLFVDLLEHAALVEESLDPKNQSNNANSNNNNYDKISHSKRLARRLSSIGSLPAQLAGNISRRKSSTDRSVNSGTGGEKTNTSPSRLGAHLSPLLMRRRQSSVPDRNRSLVTKPIDNRSLDDTDLLTSTEAPEASTVTTDDEGYAGTPPLSSGSHGTNGSTDSSSSPIFSTMNNTSQPQPLTRRLTLQSSVAHHTILEVPSGQSEIRSKFSELRRRTAQDDSLFLASTRKSSLGSTLGSAGDEKCSLM